MPASTAIAAQGTRFDIGAGAGTAIASLSGITKAAQAVISCTNTAVPGDVIVMGSSIAGMPEIAGRVGVVVSATGSAITCSINSANFAAAATGGTLTLYRSVDFTRVANFKSYSGFDGTKGETDVSHLESEAKEFVPGLEDFGQMSAEFDKDPTDAGQVAMEANKSANAVIPFRLVYRNGKVRAWRGFVKKWSESGGVDGALKASGDVRISGAVAAN